MARNDCKASPRLTALNDLRHSVLLNLIRKPNSLTHIRSSLVPKPPSKASANLAAPRIKIVKSGVVFQFWYVDTLLACRQTPRFLKCFPSINHHPANRFAFVHQIKTLVDVVQWHGVGDHRIDLDFAVHVPVNNLWNIRAATRAAKCGAAP